MKPVSSRTIISFISRSVNISKIPLNGHFEIAHFSTSPSQFHSFPSSSYPSRRHEEESRNVKVSVWWDFENCSLPFDMNAFRVAQSITAAIRTNGIKGPIQITAFGDVFQLSTRNQEALSSTGINITHIPHGGKSSADRSLLVDLMYWVSQNPPPAHLFLISGDRDFASILHRLRMNNYNILLASPDSAPGVLCSASSIMWQWNALVKGENLTGKHFNQPPDGPYGSWYGHYKAPLEDPFASTEAPACPRVEEQSESVAEPKLRPVPMVVMKQILKILKAYPKGISITDFRSELGKSNVSIDKDLYGYKKFSRFLFSMPHILKIQTEANGQFFLRGAAPKVPEPGESNLGISTGCTTNTGDPAEPAPALSPKINDGDASCRSTVHEKPSTSLDAKVNAKEPVKKVQGTSKRREDKAPKVPDPPPIFDNMRKAEATGSHMQPMDNQEPISELGFFSRVWRKWFGGKDSSSEQKTCGKPENCSMLSQKPEKSKETNEKCVKSAASCADPGGPVSFPTYRNENINDENIIRNSELNGGKSEEGPGYFSQIINWCKFWRSREKGENPSEEEESRKGNQIDIDAEKQEIFTRESFWNDVASFIEAPKGSNLIFQSRTRKQMAENLQKQGPAVLITLSQNDLLHLVDLLISDKKWVEECPLQTFPFKVIHAAAKSSFSNASSSNGLSSLFNGTSLQSSSRIVPESGKQRLQNPSNVEVSPPAIDNKLSSKSRGEIMADCQKLVDGILKEYPEGFNTASFRKFFLDTYGYSLDLQMLGYQKLVNLLQVMHGVKIESGCILPARKVWKSSSLDVSDPNLLWNNVSGIAASSDGELSDASRKDDDLESPWEELGPVSSTVPKRSRMELGSKSKKNKGALGQASSDYELPSDDVFSDSDDETLSSSVSECQRKPKVNEEDSSLLQILDNWYSCKEDNSRRVASEGTNTMTDCYGNDTKQSSSSGVGVNSENPALNYARKQKPSKSYLFVSDQVDDNKDRLIDGILRSLKNSGNDTAESRI